MKSLNATFRRATLVSSHFRYLYKSATSSDQELGHHPTYTVWNASKRFFFR